MGHLVEIKNYNEVPKIFRGRGVNYNTYRKEHFLELGINCKLGHI